MAVNERHNIKFTIGASGTDGSVEMDGKPLKGVRSIKVGAGVEQATKVDLEMFAKGVDVEVDAFVEAHHGPDHADPKIDETTQIGDEERKFKKK